jgi:hypothetical protein
MFDIIGTVDWAWNFCMNVYSQYGYFIQKRIRANLFFYFTSSQHFNRCHFTFTSHALPLWRRAAWLRS